MADNQLPADREREGEAPPNEYILLFPFNYIQYSPFRLAHVCTPVMVHHLTTAGVPTGEREGAVELVVVVVRSWLVVVGA